MNGYCVNNYLMKFSELMYGKGMARVWEFQLRLPTCQTWQERELTIIVIKNTPRKQFCLIVYGHFYKLIYSDFEVYIEEIAWRGPQKCSWHFGVHSRKEGAYGVPEKSRGFLGVLLASSVTD